MNNTHELLVSTRDAEALAALVGDRDIVNGAEHAAAGELAPAPRSAHAA